MDIPEVIKFLDSQVPDPTAGLPEELFLFASRITPMVNVDLLVKDGRGRTLLAWRDDIHAGKGWHVPGGIIRFRESFMQRIVKVALAELGTSVEFNPTPVAINEIILPEHRVRSHFISFLYECTLPPGYVPANTGRSAETPGFLKWHDGCPPDLIAFHEIYRAHIDRGGLRQ